MLLAADGKVNMGRRNKVTPGIPLRCPAITAINFLSASSNPGLGIILPKSVVAFLDTAQPL